MGRLSPLSFYPSPRICALVESYHHPLDRSIAHYVPLNPFAFVDHPLLKIHVYPMEHEKAITAVKKTHTTAPANGQSRKERRRAQWTPRAQQREEAAAQVAAVALKTQP
jgi:hypothetical protein